MSKRKATDAELKLMKYAFRDVQKLSAAERNQLQKQRQKKEEIKEDLSTSVASMALVQPRKLSAQEKATQEAADQETRLRQKKLAQLLLKGVGRTKKLPHSLKQAHSVSHGKNRTPNLDLRSDERLRRGQYDIEAVLDLHGMRFDQAHTAFRQFIKQSVAQDLRCILVITGKGNKNRGTGIIREALPNWVNEAQLKTSILAVRQAQPKDGGSGAYYVLLRRRRG